VVILASAIRCKRQHHIAPAPRQHVPTAPALPKRLRSRPEFIGDVEGQRCHDKDQAPQPESDDHDRSLMLDHEPLMVFILL
jgi:hypothetical protein